jgi:hypothetical protein
MFNSECGSPSAAIYDSNVERNILQKWKSAIDYQVEVTMKAGAAGL